MCAVALVTICREQVGVTLRFLAWHRHLGVDRVLLFLDNPQDPALPWIEGLDWVTPIRCDAGFWHDRGVDPTGHFTERQYSALSYGYGLVREGWVAVADADELFYFGGRGFHEVLSVQPDSVRGLRVVTAEHVAAPNGLHFRLPMTMDQCNQVYREDAKLLRKTAGLVAHQQGKSITRAGLTIRKVNPHFAVGQTEGELTDATLGPDASAALLHFVNSDFATWRSKLQWRLSARGISPRVKKAVRHILASEADPEPALARLFDRLYRMDPDMLDRLRAAGVHLTIADEILQITRALFPSAPDVSTSAEF